MVTLSIIIPVYNVEQYLAECLDSIFVNNAFKGEVICVDDGSTDGSPEILASYCSHYGNLKVIRQENAGLSAARNAGLRMATGDYVLFVDSDDYLADNAIDKFLAKLNGEDILYFNIQRFEDDDKTHLPIVSLPDVRGMNGQQYYERFFNRKAFMPCVCVWGGGYRRGFLMENSLFNKVGVTHEDEDFYPRALYFAKSISTSNDVLYYYRLRQGSIMKKYNPKQSVDYIDVASGLYDFFIDKDWVNPVTLSATYYIYYTMIFNTQKYNMPRPKEYSLRQVRKMLACSTTLQERRTALLSAVSFDLAMKYHDYMLPKFLRRLINILLH